MTEAEYEALIKGRAEAALQLAKPKKDALHEIIEKRGFTPDPKVNKYRNKKVTVDGITFDSMKEARRYGELKLMEKAGKIQGLERQRVFILAPAVILNGRIKPALKYKSDFYYMRDGAEVIEDVKSTVTATLPVFRIKQHLLRHTHGLEITLI